MPETDYKRLDFYHARHHERFVRRIEAMPRKLICQDCHGDGYFIEPITGFYGDGPRYTCGWCEGTGYVDAWRRGYWLRCQKP